ncbi:hypothetical protein KP509_04G021500 [Ceratopteris richardii]|nr:hypothetical protein KP509_04G021500 [Ceratopteris richardii]
MYEDHDLLIMQSPLGCELLGQQPIKSSLDISSLSSTMAVESHIIDSSIRISQENLAEQKEPAGSPTFYREDQQINSMNIQSSPSCERLCRTGVSQASSHQRPPSRSCKKTHTESIASETAEGQHSLRRPPSSPRLQQSSKIGNAVSIEDGSSGKANRHSSGSSKPRDLQVSQSVKHQQNIPCSESMNSAVTISCHAGLEGSTRTTNSEHVSGSSVDNASSHTRKNHRKNSKKTDIDLTLPPPLVTSHTNMQRTQSLNNISTPEEDRPVCSTVHEVKRSPSLSESLDMLSNDEANKIFSDFIAHRLSVMKKETCINSYAMPRKV